MPTVPFALRMTPQGHVLPDVPAPEGSLVDEALAREITRTFEKDAARALLNLGARHPATPLPPSVAYFRDLGRQFFTRLRALPDLEAQRARAEVPPPDARALAAMAAGVPPMTGAEYVTAERLGALWQALQAAFRAEIEAFDGPVERYLHEKHPVWNLVGRVCFHLAENKADAARPFAFLATYSTGVSLAGRVQHRPLGKALEEFAGAGQKAALLALLSPVQRAAEHSAFVRALVDSGRVFHPLAWTPPDAHRFLTEVPAIEAAGVVVRVPDWWTPQAPPRVEVQVTVGGRAPSRLGAAGLVDFDARLALDGGPLTDAEWQALRAQQAGLVRLRGRWVTVDPARLAQVLARWEEAKKAHAQGLAFHQAMRLLAGTPIEPGEAAAQPAEVERARVVAGPWLADMLARLRDPQAMEATAPGAALATRLRPYQEVGVRWLWLLNNLGLGACLADDMGLGKTIQVLALFALLKARGRATAPHLLVMPASLLANWQAELQRHAPGLTALVAHPSVLSAAALAGLKDAPLAGVDVVLTTYGTLQRADWPAARTWDTVVLDEAQAIKNPGAKQTRAAKALTARARLALTGTPVENRIGDLWSLFDFINPGLLGGAKAFGRYVKQIGAGEGGGWAPLRELVRPYLLRRLKTDRRVIADLPDKTEVRAFCGLTRRQVALYQEAVDDLARTLEGAAGIQRKGAVLAALLRFKQICNHPSQWLGDDAFEPADSGKFERLRDIVEPIALRQEKALVFTQFREMTGPLAAWLAQLFGRPGLVLHGGTPVRKRQSLVDAFQSDETVPFMVLSVKAGGTGLNLTAANHVVHFDRWWNPAVENQATDRAFRIGQRQNVLVHKFVCQGTVEERIDALIESKRALSAELIEGGGGEALLTELSDEELLRTVALDLRRAGSRE